MLLVLAVLVLMAAITYDQLPRVGELQDSSSFKMPGWVSSLLESRC